MTTQQATLPAPPAIIGGSPRGTSFWGTYALIVRVLVYLLAAVAALGICAMMVVTCLEVILRLFRVSLTGVVDIVKIAGAVTMAGALPYTTACKGHVAIEYFFQKLGRRSRTVVDAFCRICIIALFAFLSVQCLRYGETMRSTGQGTQTLQWPEWWVAYVMALSCIVMCLVKVYHLFHPGKELIKP